MTTIWNDNAERFATRPDAAASWERHAAVRRAGRLIREGDRPQALCVLARSVERQGRILLGLQARITPPCDCGGGCNDEPARLERVRGSLNGSASSSAIIRGVLS